MLANVFTLEMDADPATRSIISAEKDVLVGRLEGDIRVPHDRHMSAKHFRVECNSRGECFVQDLNSSNGTFLNRTRITQSKVAAGDRITAGQSNFLLSAEPQREIESAPRDLLTLLNDQPEPLFAILDAARDRAIVPMLEKSGEQFRSLYEGEKVTELAPYGPFLISLPKQSPCLEDLTKRMWGQGWGVFLTCRLPLEKVRHHLRHFLMVKLEDGRSVYFRFYDPSVLRVYLPTCNRSEIEEFLGPINRFLMESERGTELLEMTPGQRAIYVVPFALSPS